MVKAVSEEQLELIDVDDPKFKTVKKQIIEYEKLKEENREQGAANRTAERNKRAKVFEAVMGANLKPDANGVYHISLGGKVYDISQDSQLKIKKHNAPKEEGIGGTEDDEEGD